MKESKIQWTDHTWSPWWGCSKVSRGCKLCYADTFSKRLGLRIWGQDADRRHLSSKHWEMPLHWNEEACRRRVEYKVFPSMCDPFEDREDLKPLRRRFLSLISHTKYLQWLLLTKRPENVIEDLPTNAHLLVSVEGNSVKDRIRTLKMIRSLDSYRAQRIYGLSVEPLVEPLDLSNDLIGIDWVIVGGETGHGAQRMEGRWAQNIYSACHNAGKAFFFKQWGDAALEADQNEFHHLERVMQWPAKLGPAVTKKEALKHA